MNIQCPYFDWLIQINSNEINLELIVFDQVITKVYRKYQEGSLELYLVTDSLEHKS